MRRRAPHDIARSGRSRSDPHDAGIDVFTTVNVHHLESVNSVVEQITGVRVRETLPDAMLKRADDIELVDLPSEELQERMRAGKVYAPEVAKRALENCFTEGNLIALREIALRKAASQVESDLQAFRRLHAVTEAWPAVERLLVCVGPSPLSGMVIRTTHRMAESLRGEWMAVTVETPRLSKADDATRGRVLEHLRLADALGAETRSLTGSRVADSVLEFAREHNVTMIVIGKPTHPRWMDRLKGSLVDDIIRGSGLIEVHVVTGKLTPPMPAPSLALPSLQAAGVDVALAVLAVAGATALSWVLRPNVTASDQVMIYLVGVLVVAYRGSLRSALLTSLLCVVCFGFFFVPPFVTFDVAHTQYWLTFAVMGAFGSLVSSLVWRVRIQASAARSRQKINARLFEITRLLAGCDAVEQICTIATRQLQATFGLGATVYLGDDTIYLGDDTIDLELAATSGEPLDETSEWVAARWAHEHGAEAGVGTGTLSGVAGYYLPMLGQSATLGGIGLRMEDREAFADPERLRNSLLSSISHDMRSPVAGIIGSAELLKERAGEIDPLRREQLVDSVYKEATRLQQLVENLLKITRIEAGGLVLKREWHLLEEIIGAVLNHLAPLLEERDVDTEISPELVYLDTASVTTALGNLVENAVKYSSASSPIVVRGIVSGA